MAQDLKTDQSGYMLMNKPDYPRVSTFPNLVWVILLMMLFITVLLWAVSFVANAPLEEMSEWAKTPNPAKAPWYFIGLQELLVYFDPWIAGVMIPNQLITGLILIPYVDVSPTIQGRYAWEGRKFAISVFTFGAIMWFALIVVGQFLRGPSWQVYWPIIDYDIGGHGWVREGMPLKQGITKLKSMSMGAGATLILGYSFFGMVLPLVIPKMFPKAKLTRALKGYLDVLGPIKYFVVQSHILMILGVLGKIILRLGFNVKYILETPWFKI